MDSPVGDRRHFERIPPRGATPGPGGAVCATAAGRPARARAGPVARDREKYAGCRAPRKQGSTPSARPWSKK
eukprot:9484820-Pyramimonas_sp.AAC.1